MTAGKEEAAFDLLRRLLAGERGQATLHLAMLLEKSSPLRDSDEEYRRILPPELAELKVPPEAAEQIITTLCAEVSRNPDEGLIGALAATGAELVTQTAAKVLTHPPRPLTLGESRAALAIVTEHLDYQLAENAELVSKADLDRLVRLAEELQKIEEAGTGVDRGVRISLRINAAELLERLRSRGIIGESF